MSGEFDLIRRYFTRATNHTDLGVGDDAALIRAQSGNQLVVSTDMLVAGTHFLPDADPQSLGWKTAAVNISDMAAMGAAPRWITLALALPQADEVWLQRVVEGFAECCAAFDVDWIGGDTTRGPLNLCATIFGEVPQGQAILRSGAKPGDDIWISGQPGLAALGLQQLLGKRDLQSEWHERCVSALHRPQPRVALGLALRDIATAMLDVSDGLLGDLDHILEQSRCGALLEEALLPLESALSASKDPLAAREAVLAGGDDYELLFCAPISQREAVTQLSQLLELSLSRIGSVTAAQDGIVMLSRDGSSQIAKASGYDHFRP